jgi:hypothetical protein
MAMLHLLALYSVDGGVSLNFGPYHDRPALGVRIINLDFFASIDADAPETRCVLKALKCHRLFGNVQ